MCDWQTSKLACAFLWRRRSGDVDVIVSFASIYRAVFDRIEKLVSSRATWEANKKNFVPGMKIHYTNRLEIYAYIL